MLLLVPSALIAVICFVYWRTAVVYRILYYTYFENNYLQVVQTIDVCTAKLYCVAFFFVLYVGQKEGRNISRTLLLCLCQLVRKQCSFQILCSLLCGKIR